MYMIKYKSELGQRFNKKSKVSASSYGLAPFECVPFCAYTGKFRMNV